MNMNNLMSMMSGDGMSMAANMLSKFTGNKMSKEQLSKQIESAYAKLGDTFIEGMISMLYKEYPTETLGSLFKTVDSKEDKVKVMSELVVKAAPSVLSKMNEADLDKMYQILQRKRG